jgi:two-component system chemotaxis response regulator CheY
MGYNILIVDDSAVIRSIVRKSLSMVGLEIGSIFEASNGQEALEQMQNEWIDVVFADLNMPVMNGVEMLESMANEELIGNTPVVIVSSDRSVSRRERLEELGISGFIKKPFRPEKFRDVLSSLLG